LISAGNGGVVAEMYSNGSLPGFRMACLAPKGISTRTASFNLDRFVIEAVMFSVTSFLMGAPTLSVASTSSTMTATRAQHRPSSRRFESTCRHCPQRAHASSL
jgi:hypothetical protein